MKKPSLSSDIHDGSLQPTSLAFFPVFGFDEGGRNLRCPHPQKPGTKSLHIYFRVLDEYSLLASFS
jgi:hypothetical protein